MAIAASIFYSLMNLLVLLNQIYKIIIFPFNLALTFILHACVFLAFIHAAQLHGILLYSGEMELFQDLNFIDAGEFAMS